MRYVLYGMAGAVAAAAVWSALFSEFPEALLFAFVGLLVASGCLFIAAWWEQT